MRKILFLNHTNKKCGVYQYGLQVFLALQDLHGYHFDYSEWDCATKLDQLVRDQHYWAIIYNFHDYATTYIGPGLLKKHSDVIHICLAHEMSQEIADEIDDRLFDYYLFGDPLLVERNPRVFKIGRVISDYQNNNPLPKIVTVGSFGFAGVLKQFGYLIDLVQKEFDEAIIRLNIPYNDVMDKDGKAAKSFAESCFKRIKKPGIQLKVTHEFFTQDELFDFLAGNTINVFPYAECGWPGISSAVDQALAVHRPVAISDCYFFRHLFSITPSIVLPSPHGNFFRRLKSFCREIIENRRRIVFYFYKPTYRALVNIFFISKRKIRRNSLKKIVENGIAPLKEVYSQWNRKNFQFEIDEVFKKIAALESQRKFGEADINHTQLDANMQNDNQVLQDEKFELTILSIFRESQSYLPRYFKQVGDLFALRGVPCHAVWLEGDSEDDTYQLLSAQKELFESLGHKVTLVKFDLAGPFWRHSVNDPSRWRQLATCWNKCMDFLLPSNRVICVESDLIWDPIQVVKLIEKLNDEREVICPMIMTDQSVELFGIERFYDSWGFSRNGKKFDPLPPYWETDPQLIEDNQFLELSTGGGMIISTYDVVKRAKWALDACILQFPPEIRVFMDKKTCIYHPIPEKWKNISMLNRMLRIFKYRTIMLGKSLKKRVVT